MIDLSGVKRIYFIGVGGSSMSSLAEISAKRGYTVGGSDMQTSATEEHLKTLGITVFIGHKAENVKSFAPDIVVKTDAIMDTNPELIYAVENNMKIYRRAEFLGNILDGYKNTVGVAGTHGKTTTTSMLTSVFIAAERDPSAIIGGHMKLLDSSYLIGSGDDCVFESCEFKRSFMFFKSDVSVILNIAEDHMEYFKTLENLISAFRDYLSNVREGGAVVINAEDENSLEMIKGYTGRVVSFGMEKGDFTAKNISDGAGFYEFDIYKNEAFFAHIKMGVAGKHNIKNALATAAAADLCGIAAEKIALGLGRYNGTKRRFEYHCRINGAIIADDYAHHPDAYKVTFDTARDLGFRRIIAIHQPHTFSRTKMLMDDFVNVLKTVDKVLVTPIYAARETNDSYHIYAQDVVDRLPNAELLPDFDAVADRIKELAEPGDLFITLGCGDIYKAAELTAKKYGEEIF